MTGQVQFEQLFDGDAQLPEGWVACEMRDIARIVGGGTPSAADPTNFADSGHAWVTPADLGADKSMYVSAGRRFLTQKGLRESSATLLPPGAVIFSSRAPIGYVAVAANEMATNQGCRSFICTQGVVPEFLYFVLQFTKPLAEELASGTTFLEISGTNAGRIPIWLPPTPEQYRIASRLKEIQESLRRTRIRLERAMTALKRFRQSVLAAACSGRLTEDWREEHTEDLWGGALAERIKASHFRGGEGLGGKAAEPSEGVHDLDPAPFPDRWAVVELMWLCEPGRSITYGILKPGDNVSNGIPYIRVADFPGNRLNASAVRRTSKEIAAMYKRSSLNEGDILLSIRGSAGRVCRVPPELTGANITQDTARISVHHELSADYVETYLCCPSTQNRLQRAMRGVAVRGVNIGDVRALQVALPPMSEQIEIVRRVQALLTLADVIDQRIAAAGARADQLTQAILAKAFRGELTPTEAELARSEGREYETALAMLERGGIERRGHATHPPEFKLRNGTAEQGRMF